MLSTEQATALAEAVEKLTRTIPGVETLYPTGGAVAQVLESAAEAVGLRSTPCPVTVEVAEEVTVRLSLATDSTVDAHQVAREVAGAVVALFRTGGLEEPRVELTVARVADPLPS